MPWIDPEADAVLLVHVWPDGENLDPPVLSAYLGAAREACEAFAPVLGEGAVVPESYRLAQLMQAANLWNASQASPGGDMDGGGFGLSTHPLDWQVRQLLRPRRGIGALI